jgi:hypothetical protein
MLQAVLKVVGGKQDGKLIPLNTKKFLIGREQDCHLRPGSESVSRHHCAITIDDFTVRVRDLGSSNGTSINGKRIIGVHEANPGDALQVGNLDFEIVFSKAGTPVPSGAPEKGGTSFALDEFNLETAEPLSDTAMMVGGDTAVISKKDLEADAAKSEGQIAATAEQPSAEPQASVEPLAEAPASEQPVETQSNDQQPAEGNDAPPADPVAAEASTPDPAQPAAQAPPAVLQPPAPQPGYPQQQPAAPAMPGYGQQMPQQQQPYPYGMPQQGMPQPGMPGYGMPQQGYPYGVPQPGMPGYGMPQQPAMPGYGMPQQPAMPGYGMPQQPAMPYPAQQVPYPAEQPVDDYDDEEEDVEDSSKIVEPPTALPDPSETGAVEEVKTDVDEGPKVEAPNPAADILKKYMGGR